MAEPNSKFRPQLLIFDLDGTLIDSEHDIVNCVNRTFFEFGFSELSNKTIMSEFGRGSEYLFRRLLGGETSDDTIQMLVSRYKTFYAKHFLDQTQVYPGVFESLVHYRSIPKVVVTNKSQFFTDQIIAATGLQPHFAGVFGPETFRFQKPDPAPVIEVCERWNVQPVDTVVIGDSEYDIRAGKAAGARTVRALYGYGDQVTLKNNPPDYKIHSASELIGLFLNS